MAIDGLRQALALFPLLALLLGGCAGMGGAKTADDTFLVPPQIEDNVAFWRNVYATWGLGQVAFHDDQHLGVIYEVVDLPGPTHGSYTPEQRALVRARKAYLAERLHGLETKVAAGEPLDPRERALKDKLVAAAGPGAITGAHERVRSQRGIRERFRRGVEISGRYDDAFREIFRERGLPEDLAYLPHVESSFQVHARSSAGAAGLWQFTRGTGKLFMTVNHAVDERLDPIVAAQGAAAYLDQAYSKLGSWPLAVTSYNHGQGGMQNAKAIYGDDLGAIVRHYRGRWFGFASRNFYAQFLAAREVAGNPRKYFPEGVRIEEALVLDRLVLRHGMPVHHLAGHYALDVGPLAELNPHWLKPARLGRAHLPAGSTVWLPAGTLQRVAAEPGPAPVLVARTERRAPSRPAADPGDRAKVHVVQPNETLYRVAVSYDLSVDELKRLNRMSAQDSTIRPGQRLRVSG